MATPMLNNNDQSLALVRVESTAVEIVEPPLTQLAITQIKSEYLKQRDRLQSEVDHLRLELSRALNTHDVKVVCDHPGCKSFITLLVGGRPEVWRPALAGAAHAIAFQIGDKTRARLGMVLEGKRDLDQCGEHPR